METMSKVNTQSRHAQVYKQLKESLLSGAWQDGERLPSEAELCKQFGVSRVTVRTALQQLSILGMIETRQGGGSFAKRFSLVDRVNKMHPVLNEAAYNDLITVLEYRKIIETGAAALAASRVTKEDIAAMEALYQTMEGSFDNLDVFGEADIAFHAKIANITRNPIVIRVGELLTDIIITSMADVIKLLGPAGSHRHHRVILDSLVSRDENRAREAMAAHIDAIIKHVKRSATSVQAGTRSGAGRRPAKRSSRNSPRGG